MFCIAFCDKWFNSSSSKFSAYFVFRIIRAICQGLVRPFASSTVGGLDRWDGIHQRNRHFRIVHVGARMFDGQRNSVSVGDHMAFRAIFASIRGIGSSFYPPKTARTLQLSIADVVQSMTSAKPSSSSSTFQTFCQTPAACQSRRRRQHVIPEPHPISCGKYSQGVPVFNTNKIPVNALRSEMRGRPPFGLGGSGGNNGLIRSQSSLGNSGLAMAPSLTPR